MHVHVYVCVLYMYNAHVQVDQLVEHFCHDEDVSRHNVVDLAPTDVCV